MYQTIKFNNHQHAIPTIGVYCVVKWGGQNADKERHRYFSREQFLGTAKQLDKWLWLITLSGVGGSGGTIGSDDAGGTSNSNAQNEILQKLGAFEPQIFQIINCCYSGL